MNIANLQARSARVSWRDKILMGAMALIMGKTGFAQCAYMQGIIDPNTSCRPLGTSQSVQSSNFSPTQETWCDFDLLLGNMRCSQRHVTQTHDDDLFNGTICGTRNGLAWVSTTPGLTRTILQATLTNCSGSE
jgi:hypothetical protein